MRDALPKASFIGFTSTPIESGDKNTGRVRRFGFPSPATSWFPRLPFALSRAVVIDVYDILQAKEDQATVPIYYAGSAPAPGAVNRALAVHRSA